MAERDLSNLANHDYTARVNRAIDYIIAHLDGSLRLEEVASVACFSPYHFHRVFQSLSGETLSVFVKRLRLERAVGQLAFQKGKSLTEVALDCGFASSSDFSRSFRKHFGVPPSAFDVERYRASQRGQLTERMPQLEPLPPGENPDGFEVTFRDYPERHIAYIRVRQPYEPGRVTDAAERLVAWSDRRGLRGGEWLGYMWDVPEISALDDCRYDVGLVVPETTEVDGEVGRLRFPAMQVAEIEIAGSIELEQRAIDWLYRSWLPTSGYSPDDQPAFESWIGEPFAHGVEHFELRAQLPVVRG